MNIRELAGRQIDEYTLVDIIGMGGMSAVYRTYQEELDRHVAMKILPEHLATSTEYVERFNQEAKLAASLEHPHIVPIYDFGIHDDLSYVVMRLLATTLTERIELGISMTDVLEMVEAVAKALDYGHSRGILHRDIKPANIMFDEQGLCYLVDFGIARLMTQDVRLTSDNIVLGTPGYMSPEQWSDENVGGAIDQYALAVVTYQALTGKQPYRASTPQQYMYQHMNADIPRATDDNANLPVAVNAVLQRGMAKQASARYPSVTAFADALKDALQGALSGVTQPSFAVPPVAEPTQRNEPVPTADVTMKHPIPAPVTPARTPTPAQVAPVRTPTPAPIPRRPKASRKPNTVVMQMARGGMFGIGMLLILIIVAVIAILALFPPASPAEPTASSNPTTVPVTNEVAATNQATPDIVITQRGSVLTAIPTFSGTVTGASQVEVLYSDSVNPVRDAAYSPNGQMIAAAHADGVVRLWQNGAGSGYSELRGHSDVVSAVAFSPDGRFLASGGRDLRVIVWDTTTGAIVNTYTGHTGAVRDVAISPDGRFLASAAEDGTVRLDDIAGRGGSHVINATSSQVLSIAFSPDNQTIVSGDRFGQMRFWQVLTGAHTRTIEAHSEETRSVAFSPDGSRIATSSTDNSIIIWNAATGERLQTISNPRDVFSVAFHPSGTVLASGGRDNTLRLWDVASGAEISNLTNHGGWVFSIDFTSDGSQMISASGDGTLRLWQIR